MSACVMCGTYDAMVGEDFCEDCEQSERMKQQAAEDERRAYDEACHNMYREQQEH